MDWPDLVDSSEMLESSDIVELSDWMEISKQLFLFRGAKSPNDLDFLFFGIVLTFDLFSLASFSKSSMREGSKIFFSVSQVLYLFDHPSHLTRYSIEPFICLFFLIFAAVKT